MSKGKNLADEPTPAQAVEQMKMGSVSVHQIHISTHQVMLKLTRGGTAPHFRLFQISPDHTRLQVRHHTHAHTYTVDITKENRGQILWYGLKHSTKLHSPSRRHQGSTDWANHRSLCTSSCSRARGHFILPGLPVDGWEEGQSHSPAPTAFQTEDRTLDIVCKDKREFDVWVIGLRSLTLDPTSVAPDGLAPTSMPGDSLQVQFRGGTTVVHRTEMAADLYTFGEGANGRLGHGDESDVLVPKVVEALLGRDVQHIDAGPHTAALTGGGGLFTWGPGGNGRLGHGHERDRFTPLLVGSLREQEVASISCGDHHTACITDDGRLFSWGKGSHGRLGYEVAKQLVPRQVESLAGKAVRMVSAGYVSTVVVLESGEMLTWGGGDKGQLGLSTPIPYSILPNPISALKDVIHVSCGSWHMACATESGRVYTWGQGAHGKLGHGDESDHPEPTLVDGLSHIKAIQVACGDYHTLVLADDGDVYSFGEGHYGQLGLGTTDAQYSPQPLKDLHRVRRLSCGSNHSAAVTEDGRLFTWGYGVNGRLGHGDEIDRLEPTPVESVIDKQVQEVACGASHTIMTVTHGWVPDGETSACMGCKALFTFVRRRHHCRNCGGVFCGACTTHKYPLLSKGFSEAVRVCDKCWLSLSSVSTL